MNTEDGLADQRGSAAHLDNAAAARRIMRRFDDLGALALSTVATTGPPTAPRFGRRKLVRRAARMALAVALAPALRAPVDAAPERTACATGSIPIGGICRFVSPRQRAWLQRQGEPERDLPWFTLLATGPRIARGRD